MAFTIPKSEMGEATEVWSSKLHMETLQVTIYGADLRHRLRIFKYHLPVGNIWAS